MKRGTNAAEWFYSQSFNGRVSMERRAQPMPERTIKDILEQLRGVAENLRTVKRIGRTMDTDTDELATWLDSIAADLERLQHKGEL